tara:strand:- start:3416 stop:3808 length:393 start_codon:yes stop_codon:yes gene_type:complete
LKIFLNIALALTVAACGSEEIHPKSYYKENDTARHEMRALCDDRPAEAQTGNCMNAEAAYREVYLELKERRNAERQEIADKLEEFDWIKLCVDVPDLHTCRADMQAGAEPINAELEQFNADTRAMLDALR